MVVWKSVFCASGIFEEHCSVGAFSHEGNVGGGERARL